MSHRLPLVALLLILAGCGSAEERDEGGLRSAIERSGRNEAPETKSTAPAVASAPAETSSEEARGGVDGRSPADPGTAQRRAILDA